MCTRYDITRVLSNPWVWALTLLYLGSLAIVVSIDVVLDWKYIGIIAYIIIGSVVIQLATRRVPQNKDISIRQPKKEGALALGYALVYIFFMVYFWKSLFEKSIVLYQLVGLWLLLVVIPMTLLKLNGYSLPGMGLSRPNRRIILSGFIISLFLIPIIIPLTPTGSALLHGELTFRHLIALPIAFVIMVLTAGFQEEFFFRRILQPRLAALFSEEIRALVLTSFIFALYHLPFLLYDPNVGSKGLLYVLAFTVVTKLSGGILFGLIWIRTKSLWPAIILHSMQNALAVLTQFNF